MTQRYLTLAQLGKHWGISRRTLYKYVKSGQLRVSRLPLHHSDTRPRLTQRTHWRVHEDDAQRFLETYYGKGR